MNKSMIIAANWKMHHGPRAASAFFDAFLDGYEPTSYRDVWFFPSAIALPTVADRLVAVPRTLVGAQDVFWEVAGAYTGQLSIPMAAEGGARAALVGHSERRHVFGETDEETGRKVLALLEAGLTPMLCVGERLEERESGETISVVNRQLGVLEGIDAENLATVVIAYEPVWAIGTGKTATPEDASEVHREIRQWMVARGAPPDGTRVLYGGSVKPANADMLLREDEIDGVLVGGASIDPASWLEIVGAGVH